MKKLILFLFIILLIPCSIALEPAFNDKTIWLNLDISGEVEIQGNPEGIDYVIANLSFFPRKTDYQTIEEIDYSPEPKSISDNDIVFRWDNPDKIFSFRILSTVKKQHDFPKVKEKINFPIEDLDQDLKKYILPTEKIDSNNRKVTLLAKNLSKGEDDLYVVVFNLAKWLNQNIMYDLSSATSNINQKASWVIDNKRGVCDEITTLFIAMCRSLGIPARFVSGVAYSNLDLFEEPFGPHAWAEVYFPDYGWIEFDPTYGQLGFVDATHVRLKETINTQTSSTNYQWSGINIEETKIKTTPLDIKTEIVKKEGFFKPNLDLTLMPLFKNEKLNSYNALLLEIQNNEDFYVAEELVISKVKGVEVLDGHYRFVLLEPNKKTYVYWLVKLSDNLIHGYTYNFPFQVNTGRNQTAYSDFNVSRESPRITKQDVLDLLDFNILPDEKEYSNKVDLTCNTKKKIYYLGEEILIDCNINNNGDKNLNDIEICSDDDCVEIDLQKKQSKDFLIKTSKNIEVLNGLIIKAKNNLIYTYETINITLVGTPNIEIINVSAPDKVAYDEMFNINYTVEVTSITKPTKMEMYLNYAGSKNVLTKRIIHNKEDFVLDIQGKDLLGNENIIIGVNYEDKLEKKYQIRKKLNISLEPLTIMQKINIFFTKLMLKIIN